MRKAECLEQFVSWFTEKKISYVVVEQRFFLCSEKLSAARLDCAGLKVCGLLLGQMKNECFAPSFGLLDWLAECCNEKMVVNGYGEIDFLYGKHLRKRHVVSISGSKSKDAAKLVENEHGEVLGFGFLAAESSSKVLLNGLDRGILLKWDVGKAKKKQ